MDECEMDDYKAIESGKDYLAHHGVKGMKWGIRHDPERIGRTKKAIKNVGQKIVNSVRSVRSRKNAKAIKSGNPYKVAKRFDKMSTSELQDAVTRVNLQKQLASSLNQDRPQKETFVGDIKQDTKNSGRSAYRTIATGALTAGGMAMLAGVNPIKEIRNVGRNSVLRNQSELLKNQANIAVNQNRINEAIKKAQHVKVASLVNKAGKADVGRKYLLSNGNTANISRIVTNPSFKYGKAIYTGSTRVKELHSVMAANKALQLTRKPKVASYITRMAHSDFVDLGEDYLSHHGVKGMKWGIRHDPETAGQFRRSLKKNEKKYILNTEEKLENIRKANKRYSKLKKMGLSKNGIQLDPAYKEYINKAKEYDKAASEYRNNNDTLVKNAKNKGYYTSVSRNSFVAGPKISRNTGVIIGGGTFLAGPLVGAIAGGAYLGSKTYNDLTGFGKDYAMTGLNKWGDTPTGILTQKYKVIDTKSKISKLQSKNDKLESKMQKALSKKSNFDDSWKGTAARKADIRLAKQKHLGLIGSHYLAKSKKMDFKIAKLDKKIRKNNTQINKWKSYK